jgi:hypothetical protein
MEELKLLGWEPVPIDKIRLETMIGSNDPLCYNDSLYLLRKIEIFTEQAALQLLQLHPIFAIRDKDNFRVIAGARTFEVVAASLDPKRKISIALLDSRTTDEQLNNLRYYDLAITPLLLSLAGSASDIYSHCNSAKPEKYNGLPLLNSSLRSFAKALGKSPAALCVQKPTGGNKRNNPVTLETDE